MTDSAGMDIRSPPVREALAAGAPLRLDLGCGGRPKPGYVAVDRVDLPGVDIVADLEAPLRALPDRSCAAVRLWHVLEHVRNFLPLMEELHRITRQDGEIEIAVPHVSNALAHSDPTHVRVFGLYTMQHFVAEADQPARRRVPDFYTKARFAVLSTRIDFYRDGLCGRLRAPLLKRLVNASAWCQDAYERRWCWLLPAWQIRWRLRPVHSA